MRNLLQKTGLLLIIAGATICISSCRNKQEQIQPAPAFNVITLDTTSAVVYNDYSTIIQSNTIVEIRPKVSGYIKTIAKQEGTPVKKGDLIIKIDDADYQQDVNAAFASMEAAAANKSNAELEVVKLSPLVEKGIISQFELETAKSDLKAAAAQYDQAKAQYENSKITLGYTNITSPVDGVLGRIYVREGSLVSPSAQDALTTVSSDGDVAAYFSYDEKKLTPLRRKAMEDGNYKPEMKNNVELLLPDGSEYKYKGKLTSATGIIDRNTGSIQLKVLFPNPELTILSGSSGILKFPYTYKGCIVIPQSATYELQDKVMVFVVNEDNTVSRKSISIEGKSGNNYVVSNLTPGTKIVSEGINKLKEGMAITPKN
ncbi:MAG: efflux RND transporter periplasmic adaptor subunit [Bacteroidales bacterium]|nr:efflux RND transporter periplasmic adaptor subunit [Bacteroidales bacterium]MBQ5881776.1 efflux RND transporter periplasmic adaptor subunit [Bacteroidales bacterium]